MVVAFYFRLHLAYFPRPVVAIFARPEHIQEKLECARFHIYDGLFFFRLEHFGQPCPFVRLAIPVCHSYPH